MSDACPLVVARKWEPEEDVEILRLVAEHGKKWNLFEQNHFHERSSASIRNRWQRLQRYSSTNTNKCKRCGKPRRGHTCVSIHPMKKGDGDVRRLPPQHEMFLPSSVTDRVMKGIAETSYIIKPKAFSWFDTLLCLTL